jgi:ribA/ribD-fused uncharacterized protein
MKITDTHVYFWNGPFSNWSEANFIDKNTHLSFTNTEQAFMWYKAMFFGATEIASQIYNSHSPAAVKALGRKIPNYNDVTWNMVRFGFMVYVNYLKYSQLESFRKALLDTGSRTLVEASPVDKVWGVGLAKENPLILDQANWQGTNLLGKALEEVRKIV